MKDESISGVLARNGLEQNDADMAANERPTSPALVLVMATVARLLEALDADMAPSSDEWSDPSCNTKFHDARAILAEVLR